MDIDRNRVWIRDRNGDIDRNRVRDRDRNRVWEMDNLQFKTLV